MMFGPKLGAARVATTLVGVLIFGVNTAVDVGKGSVDSITVGVELFAGLQAVSMIKAIINKKG